MATVMPSTGKPSRRVVTASPKAKVATKVSLSGNIIKAVRKSFGEKSVESMRQNMEKTKGDPVPLWVPNPLWGMDYSIAKFRGFPCGRGMILWGPEGSGKTALCEFVAGCFLRAQGLALWSDFDGSHDPSHLPCYGIPHSSDEFMLLSPDYAEQAIDMQRKAIETTYGKVVTKKKKGGFVDKKKKAADEDESKEAPIGETQNLETPMVAVWDSLASTASRARLEADSSDDRVTAATARMLSEQLPVFRVLLKRRPVMVVFINEIRDDFQQGPKKGWGGPSHKMPFGRALRHFGSTTLKTAIIGQRKAVRNGVDVVKGVEVLVSPTKIRLGVPGSKFRLFMSFSTKPGRGGIRVPESNLMFLEDMNMLKAAGSKGMSIKGMPELGTFTKAEWPTVHKEHSKAIRAMLKKSLFADDDVATAPKTPKNV